MPGPGANLIEYAATEHDGSAGLKRVGNYIWDSVGLVWVKSIGNASGRPQVDIVTGTVTANTKTALTASAPTAATVGVSSAQALASNANRKGLILINTSVNTISLGIGSTAVLNSGITLFPGVAYVMDEFNFAIGAINAIAGAAASNLAIQEYTT